MPARYEGQVLQCLSLGVANPTTLSLSVTTGNVALPSTYLLRVYRLWSSVDCFVRFGGSAVEATTSSVPLTAKVPEVFHVYDNSYIAGIVSSGTGTLFISELY